MSHYRFSEQTDLNQFNAFSLEHGGSVYQTSCWAEVKNAWKPSFYMGFKDGTPVLSALCLERDVRVGKLWYCPDGFVCDLTDKALVSEFCSFMKKEMKKHGICALATDPLIVEKINGEPVDDSAVDALLEGGFVRNRDKSFYVVQPAVTILTPLKGETEESLLKKCEKGVRHGLKAAEDGLLYGESYDYRTLEEHPEKLDEFFEVMTETSDRTDFIQRDKSYYKNMVLSLREHGVMDLVYCDQKKRGEYCSRLKTDLEDRKTALEALENAEKKNKKEISAVKKELESIQNILTRNEKVDKELQERYGDAVPEKLCVAVAITSRFGKTAICLYGGTRNLLRNTLRPTHYLNWLRIRKSLESGMEEHDLGRVTGDVFDEDNPLHGLAKYKMSYAGQATEYVGDLYLISDKFRFLLFRSLLPKVKKLKTTVLKNRIKNRTVNRSNKEG